MLGVARFGFGMNKANIPRFLGPNMFPQFFPFRRLLCAVMKKKSCLCCDRSGGLGMHTVPRANQMYIAERSSKNLLGFFLCAAKKASCGRAEVDAGGFCKIASPERSPNSYLVSFLCREKCKRGCAAVGRVGSEQ